MLENVFHGVETWVMRSVCDRWKTIFSRENNSFNVSLTVPRPCYDWNYAMNDSKTFYTLSSSFIASFVPTLISYPPLTGTPSSIITSLVPHTPHSPPLPITPRLLLPALTLSSMSCLYFFLMKTSCSMDSSFKALITLRWCAFPECIFNIFWGA